MDLHFIIIIAFCKSFENQTLGKCLWLGNEKTASEEIDLERN